MQFSLSPKFIHQFILLCIFTFSSIVFSQAQEKDSLDQYSFGELRLKFNTTQFKNHKLARLYANKLLAISTSNNDSLGTITAYNKLSSLESQLGNTTKALRYVDKAISIAKQNPKYIVSEIYSYYTKAILLHYLGQYKKSFKYYITVYDYYKKIGEDITMNSISLSIALIKSNLGDYETSVEILSKCLDSYENTPEIDRNKKFSEDYKVSVLLGLSSAYVKYAIKNTNKKDSLINIASEYNVKGLKSSIQQKNKYYEIDFIINTGIIEEERGNYQKAVDELNKASNQMFDYKELSSLTALYYHKGKCYKGLNQIDDAIVYFKKADSISAKNSSNFRMLQGAYYSLIEIYKERKDTKNEIKYLNLYIENERINKQISQEVRDDIHTLYDIDRFKEKIASINNSRTRAIVIIGILLTILILLFIFYNRQQKKNKLAFKKLLQDLEDKQKEPILNDQKSAKKIAIDDEKVVQVIKALDKFEEKEWFRNKNCDLAFVAKKAKTNKTYLSKIIHEHKQLKFIDYIRNLRINYALERLKDDSVFRSYDIKSIAEESGFKSSDMFSRAFVKNTGIYPSYYIKNINKINT